MLLLNFPIIVKLVLSYYVECTYQHKTSLLLRIHEKLIFNS